MKKYIVYNTQTFGDDDGYFIWKKVKKDFKYEKFNNEIDIKKFLMNEKDIILLKKEMGWVFDFKILEEKDFKDYILMKDIIT